MIDPSQIDPLTLAMLSQKMGGPNVRSIAIGGGSQLMAPQQQQSALMARALIGQDPAAARTKWEGMSRLGQQALGAFLYAKNAREMEATRDKDSAIMAAALRSQDTAPTTYKNEDGSTETITWNAPKTSTMANILGQGSPELQRQGMGMLLAEQQRKAEIAQKSVTTLPPEEVARMGLPAGTLVQRDAYGKLDIAHKPDVPVFLDGGSAPAAAPSGGTTTVPRPGVPAGTPPADYPVSPQARGTISAESGGNPSATNPNSTATGAGQFIESTWLNMMRKNAPGLIANKSREEILAMREDPELSAQATDWYAKENAPILQQAGVEPSPQNLYLAHVYGPQGAVKFLQADPRAPAYSAASQAVVEANRPLFFDKAGRPKTVQEMRDHLAGNFNKGYQVADAGTVATDAAPAGPTPAAPRVALFKGQTIEVGPDGRAKPYQQPTNDQREYEQAKRDGFPGTFMDYQIAMKKAGRAETNIDMKGEAEESKAEGKRLVEEFQGIQQRGQAAQDAIAQISIARSVPEVDAQGKELPTVLQQKIGNAAVALGFNVDNPSFKTLLGNVSNGQSFNGVMQNLVLTKMQAQKGPQTENDAKRIESTVASLGNTPEARDFLFRTSQALAQRDVDQQAFYENWRQTKGSYSGASKAWREYVGGMPMVGIQPSTQKPVFFDEFRRAYMQKYPDQNEEQMLNAWRTSYAGR